MTPDELKTERESRGLSQSQMAQALRVSVRTYQGWEMGRAIPDYVETAVKGDFPRRAKLARKGTLKE